MAYLDLAAWQALGDHQYRTVKLFETMLWGEDVNIEDYLVVAAPYGGPIALARDPTKVTAFRLAGPGASDQVTIYSASGRLLGHAHTETSRLVGIGWTSNEHLVVVHETGGVGMCVASALCERRREGRAHEGLLAPARALRARTSPPLHPRVRCC